MKGELVLVYFINSNRAFVYCLITALFPFFAFIQMNLLNSLGSKLGDFFCITTHQLGILSAVYIYSSAFLLFPAGILLDRLPIKRILLLGIFLTTLGALFLSIAHTFFQVIVSRLIAGSGHGFALLSCLRFVTLYLPTHRHGLVNGLILTLALLGGLIAQFPLSWLTDRIDLKMILQLQVFLGLFILLLIYLLIPNLNNYACNNFKSRILKKEIKNACQSIENWLAGLYAWFTYVPLMFFGALLGVKYLITMHQLTTIDASSVTSMLFIGTMIGSPLMGLISDLLKERYSLMILGPLVATGLIAILYLGRPFSNNALMAIFFLMGFFTSTASLIYPIIAENNPKHSTGTALGITNIIIMAGTASSQLLFGYVWEGTLKEYALHAIPTLLIISAIVAMCIRKKINRNVQSIPLVIEPAKYPWREFGN